LIDTDQKYGHRQDPAGYAQSLQEFYRAIPAMMSKLQDDDLLIVTGDHGNDPTSSSTNHSREFVPLLVFSSISTTDNDLATIDTFSDIAYTVSHFFEVPKNFNGKSMWDGR